MENQHEDFYNTFEEESDNVTYSNESFDEIAVNFVGIEASCIKCRAIFPSRSKLYNHLRSGYLEISLTTLPTQAVSSIPIIASKIVYQSFSLGLAFRGWIYGTAPITLTPDHLPLDSDPNSITCLNTGYGVTLVDKAWLSKRLSIQKINTMSTLLRVREIRSFKHKSGEYAALFLYFLGKDNAGQQVYASLTCEIHLVEDRRANLLIGNNIMSPENFIIDVKRKSVFIESCGVTVPIDTKQRGQFLTKKLFVSQETMVPPRSEAIIPLILLPLPDDRDFLFYPAIQVNLTLFTHLVNYQTSKMLVRNNSRQMLRILRYYKHGHLIDIAYKNCFLANTHSALDAATFPPLLQYFSEYNTSPPFLATNSSLETVLNNGIRVYGDKTAVRQIAELVAEYPTIWES